MVPYCKWIWCIVLCKRRPSSMCWKGLCLAWTSLRIDWITRSRLNGWSAACQPQQLVWILLELSVSLGNDMLCHYNILTLVLCLCSPWCLCTILLKQISFAQLGVAFQISSLVNWSVVSMIFIGVLLGKIPMLMKICSNRFWKKECHLVNHGQIHHQELMIQLLVFTGFSRFMVDVGGPSANLWYFASATRCRVVYEDWELPF